jgi:hypothetical protein
MVGYKSVIAIEKNCQCYLTSLWLAVLTQSCTQQTVGVCFIAMKEYVTNLNAINNRGIKLAQLLWFSHLFVPIDQRIFFLLSFLAQQPPLGQALLTHEVSRSHTTTHHRTHLDGWSARRRDLYLQTHNTHNRQTSMPSVGLESIISAGERPQTRNLDRAVTGTAIDRWIERINWHPELWHKKWFSKF